MPVLYLTRKSGVLSSLKKPAAGILIKINHANKLVTVDANTKNKVEEIHLRLATILDKTVETLWNE